MEDNTRVILVYVENVDETLEMGIANGADCLSLRGASSGATALRGSWTQPVTYGRLLRIAETGCQERE